ncbi:MAG: hypothetical protein ACJA1D_001838 [Polaribacter sp.]|jgi:hypothetical protein
MLHFFFNTSSEVDYNVKVVDITKQIDDLWKSDKRLTKKRVITTTTQDKKNKKNKYDDVM